MLPTTQHYQWKIYNKEYNVYMTPRSDPMEYEFSFDMLFATTDEAHQGLIDYDAVEDAKEENWVLCIVTIQPLK
jgi:hypothetical protein